MLITTRHSLKDRVDDFYRTPTCAVQALIGIEGNRIPRVIWEPACGDGAIVKPLEAAGRIVVASDLVDRGAGYLSRRDYLMEPVPEGVQGVITNPPYKLAMEFVEKAVREVPYSAWLLRLNFLESVRRMSFFKDISPARVLISSRRLPMMHRDGWAGPKNGSNACHAWFIWDGAAEKTEIGWFDWEEWGDG
jgi:hypothetical protein